MSSGLCYATGVAMGADGLRALCQAGLVPRVAIGYDESLRHRSGYTSLRPLSREYGFGLVETNDINGEAVLSEVTRQQPALLVVAGWSQIVRPELLDVFPRGCFGVHPTALPRGRGRAPIPWTLIKGLSTTAVTVFRLEQEVDAGDIVGQEPVCVSMRDDAASLYEKLTGAQSRLLLRLVPALLAGTAQGAPQTGSADMWPRRTPEQGIVDWTALDGRSLYNFIRGLSHPYPGAFTRLPDGRCLRIWSADWVEQTVADEAAGTVLGAVWSTDEGGVAVATAGGELVILRTVQVEGEEQSDALTLLERQALRPGDRLG